MLQRLIIYTVFLFSAIGCAGGDPTEPYIPDGKKMYSKLELKHKAILLSVHEPYDTIRLVAVPRNPLGDSIQHTGSLSFRQLNPLDASIRLDSSGFVKARAASNGSRIEVKLTIGSVTQLDTAVIMVRTELPVRKVQRTEFFPLPPDSSWLWAGERSSSNARKYERWLRIFDDDEVIIPSAQLVVSYSWDDWGVLSFSTGSGAHYPSASGLAGETYIHAKLFAYDTALHDSVLFQRIDPPVRIVVIDRIVPAQGEPSIAFFPGTLYAKTGNTVFFANMLGLWSGSSFCILGPALCGNKILHEQEHVGTKLFWVDSVDIQFENPDLVDVGDSYGTMYFSANLIWPTDGGNGNIPAFAFTRCENFGAAPRDDCGGLKVGTLDPGVRARKFNTPGIYHYSSTRYPGVRGTIIVED